MRLRRLHHSLVPARQEFKQNKTKQKHTPKEKRKKRMGSEMCGTPPPTASPGLAGFSKPLGALVKRQFVL
jgi:hypothetical protein